MFIIWRGFGWLVPGFFARFGYDSIKGDKMGLIYLEQPAVNDMYLSDYSRLFEGADKEYWYGILRVKNVTDKNVELWISNMGYKLKNGPREDIRKKEILKKDYFGEDIYSVARQDLIDLKNKKAIYSVSRSSKR